MKRAALGACIAAFVTFVALTAVVAIVTQQPASIGRCVTWVSTDYPNLDAHQQCNHLRQLNPAAFDQQFSKDGARP